MLDVYAFGDLEEVRDESTRWLHRYNHDRPHRALGRQPPAVYRAHHDAKRTGEPTDRGSTPLSGIARSTSP